jgi:hypothetical protein
LKELVGHLQSKFHQVDTALSAQAAPPPDSLEHRVHKLELKHTTCAKALLARLRHLDERADAFEVRLGECEDMAVQAKVRSLASCTTLTLVQNQVKGIEAGLMTA